MSTATLSPLDPHVVALAASDVDEYHALRAGLHNDAQRRAFDAAVDAVYRDAHPLQPLAERETRILQFAGRIARREFRTPGHCEQAIRDQFDMSATRYHQVLNALIDRPEALKAYPVLVNRLRGQRAAMQARRGNRTVAQGSNQ